MQRQAFYLEQQALKQEVKEEGEDPDTTRDVEFDGGFKIPGTIYNRLFDYQQTGENGCLLLPALSVPSRLTSLEYSMPRATGMLQALDSSLT